MKKNVLKKFAAAALAAATVMSGMSVMAFAADAGTAASTGSVTITKYMGDAANDYEDIETHYGASHPVSESEATEKLKDVQFAYVEVGERVQVDVEDSKKTTTEMLYKLNRDAVAALELTNADVTESGTDYYRMSTLDTAIRSHKNKAIELVKKATENHATPTDANGTVKFSNLSLEKLYLFAETDASAAKKVSDDSSVAVTKVSVPFFVSLPFTDADGNSVKDIYAYPKNSTGTATIDKKIVENGTDKTTTTANIGDTINYKVTYNIPVGENGLESLVVTDKMSKGLTFVKNPDNIKVLNGNEEVDRTMYTVKDSKDDSTKVTTITITFDSDKYCKSLGKNTTQNFTIIYTATLNKDAVLGQSGNTNAVSVTYKNTGDDYRTTEPKGTPKVFTYGIDLLKKGEGTDVLEGVKFELTDGTNEIDVLKSGDAYYPSNDAKASSTVTTDNNGEIHIRGLKPGTYKLTETKTNDGYVLLKNPVVIVIKQTDATIGTAKATVGSKDDVTMTDDNGSATAIVPLTVVNSKGFDLPATGGRGIALFTIAGIAIVAAAGSLLFMRKRSK